MIDTHPCCFTLVCSVTHNVLTNCLKCGVLNDRTTVHHPTTIGDGTWFTTSSTYSCGLLPISLWHCVIMYTCHQLLLSRVSILLLLYAGFVTEIILYSSLCTHAYQIEGLYLIVFGLNYLVYIYSLLSSSHVIHWVVAIGCYITVCDGFLLAVSPRGQQLFQPLQRRVEVHAVGSTSRGQVKFTMSDL